MPGAHFFSGKVVIPLHQASWDKVVQGLPLRTTCFSIGRWPLGGTAVGGGQGSQGLVLSAPNHQHQLVNALQGMADRGAALPMARHVCSNTTIH